MKNRYFFLGILLLLATATACSKDDDSSPRDIESGVYYLDQQIVLADRNLGATKIGGIGTYLTNGEAATACPEGYHLMTKPEARALIADSRYNTAEKFFSAFKMPVVQYIDPTNPSASVPTDIAYYNLRECIIICYPNGRMEFGASYPYMEFNTRCVKGEDPTPIESTSVTGSAQLPDGTTMSVAAAGFRHLYPDHTLTQLIGYSITLTPVVPTDNYVNQPEELILLRLSYTENGNLEVSTFYYADGTFHINVPISSNNPASLDIDRNKRTFKLSIEVKSTDSANSTDAKISCQGTFLDLGDYSIQ